jgi:predicted enzyme related to lactoylglutathione lyase
MSTKKGRITGIGGVFFKCQDPDAIKKWYADHFQLDVDKYGTMFKFHPLNQPDKLGYLQWSPFNADTNYFDPSEKDFMINYRVENIEALVEEMKAGGVTVLDDIETYDYGKFVHILDPEGHKIELWEPVDAAFDDYYEKKNT